LVFHNCVIYKVFKTHQGDQSEYLFLILPRLWKCLSRPYRYLYNYPIVDAVSGAQTIDDKIIVLCLTV